MECGRCDAPAIVDRPYAGDHLCERHLRRSIEERFRRAMHRQLPRFPGGTVALAISGGKDSATAATLATAYFRRRPNVRLVALTVDEGIAGYRPPAIRAAAALADRLGVAHRIVRAADAIGATTDEAARRLDRVAPCSFCGVWRRQLLNRAARDEGADVLVLGFNLDDLAQTVLMNLARAEIARMPRMAPHRERRPGLVPRIAPLGDVPEREAFLYARLAGLPFDHSECPHAGRAARNVFRDVLWRLEGEIPGTRQALLRTHGAIVALLGETAGGAGAPGTCVDCGEPATGTRCRGCAYREALKTSVDLPVPS